MTSKYQVFERMAIDCEGRDTDWKPVSEYLNTEAEAREIGAATPTKFPHTGDYKIIKRTIDEATFTVLDETVYLFDYYKEVKRYIIAQEYVDSAKSKISELQEKLKKFPNERTQKRLKKEIAFWEECLERDMAILNERG